jgi:hypothetical protein
MVQDVVDTLRALRCADASPAARYGLEDFRRLRGLCRSTFLPRGFLAVAGRRAALSLRVPDRIGAGEANMASSELDKSGNLHLLSPWRFQ